MKPNYKHSIVNLMASIERKFNGKSMYKPLNIKFKDNVILFVIDGLGYEWLKEYGKDTIFYEHLKDKMTSVFPSTTTAAISSFQTGVAPQQHAFTGWYMNLKEYGSIVNILRFETRLRQQLSDPNMVFTQVPFANKIKADPYFLIDYELVDSEYTTKMGGKAKRIGFRTLDSMFWNIRKLLKDKKKKYIYSYWHEFDSLFHMNGEKSEELKNHINELDTAFRKFINSVKDTTIIITADHGLIDQNEIIILNDHPKLYECLSMPLCGEPRAAFCYVYPDKVKQFKDYVKKYFKDKCELIKSKDLIKKEYFGLGKINPKLYERIGDYCLLAKGNVVILDRLMGEHKLKKKAHHGGLSKKEMLVPLIIIQK